MFIRRLLAACLVVLLFAIAQPAQANIACQQGASVPAVAWLTPRLDSVTVHHFWWRPGEPTSGYGPQVANITDKRFIASLTRLTGSSVPWLGYDHAAPFGGFTYPKDGTWFSEYELHVGGNTYQSWVWDEFDYSYKNVLVFTFANMNVTGTPAGEHDFCAVSVAKSALNAFDPDVYLTWRP